MINSIKKHLSLSILHYTHLDQAWLVWGGTHHSCNWIQVLCSFLDLLKQSNSHINLAYQLLQTQHPLKSASELAPFFICSPNTPFSLIRTSWKASPYITHTCYSKYPKLTSKKHQRADTWINAAPTTSNKAWAFWTIMYRYANHMGCGTSKIAIM